MSPSSDTAPDCETEARQTARAAVGALLAARGWTPAALQEIGET